MPRSRGAVFPSRRLSARTLGKVQQNVDGPSTTRGIEGEVPLVASTGARKKPTTRKKSTARKKSTTRKKPTARKKSTARKYGPKAGKKVERAMREMKRGELKSGRSGRKVTNPKQAIAIGLSEARSEGGKVPKPATARKKSAR